MSTKRRRDEWIYTQYHDGKVGNLKHGVCTADGQGSVALSIGSEANARLIAAAPEILEALQGLVRAYEALPGAVTHNGSRHSHAVYAIRKAMGEEK